MITMHLVAISNSLALSALDPMEMEAIDSIELVFC
jgi:hypothetical protein